MGRGTVTWLPKFFEWIDNQILLAKGLHEVSVESSALKLWCTICLDGVTGVLRSPVALKIHHLDTQWNRKKVAVWSVPVLGGQQ